MFASQMWWHVARTSGLVAWLLLTLSMLWGLLLSTRVLGRRPGRPWLYELHRYFSALSLAALAAHVVALFLDHYVEFSVADLTVPFAASWSPGALAAGIIAAYLLVAIEVTSLLGDRMPRGVWRGVHLTAFVGFVLATAHGLLAGTDASNPIVRLVLVVGVAELVFLTAVRAVYRRRVWSTA